MSNVTRGGFAAVIAAVRGKSASRMEGENPEDENNPPTEEIEGEEQTPEEEAEGTELDQDAEAPAGEDEEKVAASARLAERKRIHGILTHPQASANPGLAAEMAFGNRAYSVKEAGALLSAGGPVQAVQPGLSSRMAGRSPQLGGGSPAPANARASLVASVGNFVKARHGRNSKG